jgi:nucleoside-diphosphate-sugar epimerase
MCAKWEAVLNKVKQTACVTGASGMVGSKIVQRLISHGYKVRILSRSKYFDDPDIELFRGGLEDEEVLKSFLGDAHLLFHCAAELRDTSKMWDVNVSGTERLVHLAGKLKIQYLCYLSSAGVVGKAKDKWVDEKTRCEPQNAYERSKWAAEKIAKKGIDGCRIVILRPTNVVDGTQMGELIILKEYTPYNRLKLFITGGESSHIIHADNVSAAAIHFIDKSIESPDCFFVSSDNEPATTFSDLCALYKQLSRGNSIDEIYKPLHLPIFIPYFLRKIIKGTGNMGDVRYSSEKLLSTGFKFPLSIEDTLRQIFYSDK